MPQHPNTALLAAMQESRLDPCSRGIAIVMAVNLAKAFLNECRATQAMRSELGSNYYWAEDLIERLEMEARAYCGYGDCRDADEVMMNLLKHFGRFNDPKQD